MALETVTTEVSSNDKVGTYTTTYPNNGINLGFGWNWISEDSGLSGGIKFVSIVGGSPLHTYKMETGWTCSDSCKASYETIIDDYVPTTTGHVTIGYNFNL